MIKRMELNGYVTRERCKNDERKVLMTLTKKAQDNKEAILSAVKSCLTVVTKDQDEYFHLLHQINQLAKKVGGITHEKSL